MPIVVRIDVELAKRKMSVGEFAERVGLTPANVAVLKNGRAKAVRFSTLEAMCRVLDCQPGDLLEWVERGDPMKYVLTVAAVLVVALGVAGIVHGEADDSPGLQLLGVVLVLGALVFGIRNLRGGS